MATQPTLCDGCELDYFYIIGKYHGGVFPRHEKFALDFFREHKVLPLSVKCANCNSESANLPFLGEYRPRPRFMVMK